MQLLDNRRIPGSEFNSAARHPPPQCHPGTRQTLQGKISSWLVDPQRDCRMLWVLGPAGVGKSAVAQTVADHYSGGLLGAAFFFSGLSQRDDPYRVIPTIAHQLARQYPDYKQIITRRFADDSSILEKTLRTQFNELIIEPFRFLAAVRPPHLQQPCLIILDGLDECRGEEEQCEFIQLISDHVRQVKNFPLLWMVCSRPEWHLKSLLADSDFQITCIREELEIDDTEARDDVFHVLSDGFDSIRRKYRDRLSITWPPLTSLNQLADAASGHFGFASTVLGFVGDRDCGDPGGQLNICIQILKDGRVLESKNPFRALDLLYTHILSRVPVDILPITMTILGFSIFVHSHQLSAQVQANFLHLDQSAFYHSLQKLHSILRVPEPRQADMKSIEFYHASFGDFLKDPNRSNIFALDQANIYSNLQDHALCWYQCTLLDSLSLFFIAYENFSQISLDITLTVSQTIPWSPHATKKNWILSQLRDFASYFLIFYV